MYQNSTEQCPLTAFEADLTSIGFTVGVIAHAVLVAFTLGLPAEYLRWNGDSKQEDSIFQKKIEVLEETFASASDAQTITGFAHLLATLSDYKSLPLSLGTYVLLLHQFILPQSIFALYTICDANQLNGRGTVVTFRVVLNLTYAVTALATYICVRTLKDSEEACTRPEMRKQDIWIYFVITLVFGVVIRAVVYTCYINALLKDYNRRLSGPVFNKLCEALDYIWTLEIIPGVSIRRVINNRLVVVRILPVMRSSTFLYFLGTSVANIRVIQWMLPVTVKDRVSARLSLGDVMVILMLVRTILLMHSSYLGYRVWRAQSDNDDYGEKGISPMA